MNLFRSKYFERVQSLDSSWRHSINLYNIKFIYIDYNLVTNSALCNALVTIFKTYQTLI